MYLKRKINLLILFIIIVIIVIIVTFHKIYDIISAGESIENTNFENFIQETVTDDKFETIKIHIDGFVKSPGILELTEGSRIADAIEKAGGLLEEADIRSVNLAYVLQDGEKIYIPSKQEAQNAEEQLSIVTSGNGDSASSSNKVNINKATLAELQKISGIGESTAQKIIDYRNENGKFKNIEELKNITRHR